MEIDAQMNERASVAALLFRFAFSLLPRFASSLLHREAESRRPRTGTGGKDLFYEPVFFPGAAADCTLAGAELLRRGGGGAGSGGERVAGGRGFLRAAPRRAI